MAIITAPAEVAKLRRSGKISAAALQAAARAIRPGVTTAELNVIAEKEIRSRGGQPSFLGYQGYTASLCTSINDEVVHGIPSAKRKLKEGDIIGLDIGAIYEGVYTDHAMTFGVGKISPAAQELIDDTARSLELAIQAVRVGGRIGDIGAAVEKFLNMKKYGIVTQLTGHGVGYAVHEPPSIFNIGPAGKGPSISAGMVLAIEPMVTTGSPDVETEADGWTVVTRDGSLAAHFEHTILVTAAGAEIITHE